MKQEEKIIAYLHKRMTLEEELSFISEIKNNPELADEVRSTKAQLIVMAIADGEMMLNSDNSAQRSYKTRKLILWMIGIAALIMLIWWRNSQQYSSHNVQAPVSTVDTIIETSDKRPDDSVGIKNKVILEKKSPPMAQTTFEKTKPKFQIDKGGLSQGNYGAGGDIETAKLAWMQDSMQKVLMLTEDVPASSAKYLRGLAFLELGQAREAETLFNSILISQYERYSESWWNKEDVEWFHILARLEAKTGKKEELLKISSNKFHKYHTEADMLYKNTQ